MYNQYLQVKSCKFGLGVFTSVDIPGNSPIMEMTGDLFNEENAPHEHPALLQIGYNLYLGPSGDASDYVNHSCNPNCYLQIVGSRAILFSLHYIKADNQLFFDYSTTSTDTLEKWKMDCNCEHYNCRKIISGFHYLSDDLKRDYKNKGMIPLFLQSNLIKNY